MSGRRFQYGQNAMRNCPVCGRRSGHDLRCVRPGSVMAWMCDMRLRLLAYCWKNGHDDALADSLNWISRFIREHDMRTKPFVEK